MGTSLPLVYLTEFEKMFTNTSSSSSSQTAWASRSTEEHEYAMFLSGFALLTRVSDLSNDSITLTFGMPILDVDKAHTVMVIKRSMAAGFAGIDNPLYYLDKTLMLFGDAKSFVGSIVRELSGGGSHG